MNIRDIQTLLKALMNSPRHVRDENLFSVIDNAKETLLDIVLEGTSREELLNAILELLVIATMLNIDIEGELTKILSPNTYSVMS